MVRVCRVCQRRGHLGEEHVRTRSCQQLRCDRELTTSFAGLVRIRPDPYPTDRAEVVDSLGYTYLYASDLAHGKFKGDPSRLASL